MRPINRFVFALCCLTGLIAIFLWAQSAESVARITVKSNNSETFVAIPRTRESCPIVILVTGSPETILQKGPALRAIAESGVICAYIGLDKQSVDQLDRQLAEIVSDTRVVKDGNKQGLIILAEGLRSSTMLIAATKSSVIKPNVFISVPEETEINTVIDRLTKADFHCPVLIANESKSDDVVRAAKNLPSQKIEFLAFNGADDLRPRDLFFYKQLTERACEALLRSTEISNSAPLQRRDGRSSWKYFGLPAGIFALFSILWITEKINSSPNARRRFQMAIAAALIIGVAGGITAGLFVGQLPSTFQTHDAKRNAQLSALAEKWRLSATDAAKFAESSSLADYNRKLVNWKLDDRIYNEYVLNPRISMGSAPQFNWRQPLWKYFYPLIRRAPSPHDAASVVANYLRLEVEVHQPTAAGPKTDQASVGPIRVIWIERTTTRLGFEQIYVAVLRSVGVAARLNSQGDVQIWDDDEWKPAPRPAAVEKL